MPRARSGSLTGRLRLRHKLAASLSIAAILPVLAVSYVALSVVLGNLERGLRAETERQLHVGLSLVLRTVERIGADSVRIAGSSDLVAALAADEPGDAGVGPAAHEQVIQALDRMAPHLPASIVQVFEPGGRQLAMTIVGNVQSRFVGLWVSPELRAVREALGHRNPVTISAERDVLVVRAAAPVLDPSYRLEGAVVISVPLDGAFADHVKSALGTDVLLFAGAAGEPALSTFVDATGRRKEGIHLDPEIGRRVEQGETVLATTTFFERHYEVGYTALIDRAGENVGVLGVAVDRAPLLAARGLATRSLILGAAGTFVFALALAALLSRRITRPLARLHRGAQAVARGELDDELTVSDGDELGDLALAFAHMTRALKENQERLAARMRELVALHDASRAVSSVIDLDVVLHEIVDSVARVLDARLCALWLVPARTSGGVTASALELGAVRAQPVEAEPGTPGTPAETEPGTPGTPVDDAARLAEPLRLIAADVASARATLRIDDVSGDARHRDAALAADVSGSLVAAPLAQKDAVVGVLIVGRARDARALSDADASLLTTFADQAAAAVENARLYEEVRGLNEELEGKVRSRTAELLRMNAELGRVIRDLHETQAQLILSERLAGLGLLVAGVAHEINSPSAAIAGSVDALADNAARLAGASQRLAALDVGERERARYLDVVAELGPRLAVRPMGSAVAARRARRALGQRLDQAGIAPDHAPAVLRLLAQINVDEPAIEQILALAGSAGDAGERAVALFACLTEHVLLHRNAFTIRKAIERIQRIVGALKTYSHLDQQASFVKADVHEGIENTLIILDYVLRDIKVVRDYERLPEIPVYVDELNQVWTNLIQNAVQALQGTGEITIATTVEEDGVAVRVIDSGPGIASDVIPHIFEPFFTTKPKGEGTGLGLRVVRQIIEKHRGQITCESRPGRTCFRVWLPASQPDSEPDGGVGADGATSPDQGDGAGDATGDGGC